MPNTIINMTPEELTVWLSDKRYRYYVVRCGRIIYASASRPSFVYYFEIFTRKQIIAQYYGTRETPKAH